MRNTVLFNAGFTPTNKVVDTGSPGSQFAQPLAALARADYSKAAAAGERQKQQLVSQEAMRNARTEDAFQVNALIKAGDIEGAQAYVVDMIRAREFAGFDASHSKDLLNALRSDPNAALQKTEAVIAAAQAKGRIAGSSVVDQRHTRLLEDLQSGDEDTRRAARIALGLDPRAVGSADMTIAGTGATDEVAASNAVIAGAEEEAKTEARLSTELELKPEVERAVEYARGQATAVLERAGNDRSNARALAVYDAGIKSLAEKMGLTTTGPAVGIFPAVTANAQAAEGAVAIMAPILKQLFRVSGEGVFTDRDQQLLLDMVPTRKDHPEARTAKLEMIDAVVRAKLGPSKVVDEDVSIDDLVNAYGD